MRASIQIGNSALKFLTSKDPIVVKYSKHFVSTRTNKTVNRNVRAAVERKSIWESVVPNVMSNREIQTAEDWNTVRNALLQSGREITPVTIDSIILSYCMGLQNYSLGYSYMQFLKHSHLRPSLAAIGKYFRMFYLSNTGKIPKKTATAEILTLYDDLRQTYKVFDASTCENIIHAVSITHRWKESLKLLDEIKIAGDPSTSAYSVTAAAAFKNNEHDLAWNLLEEAADKDRVPHSVAFLSYLEQYEQSQSKTSDILEKLFEFFRLHDIKCDAEVARKISDLCKKLSFGARPAIISNRGVCHNCKQKFPKLELSEEDFERLKTAVLKNVIVGKNVFYRTTPDELKRFQEFVANMKKYDVVIDGLNVAYSTGIKHSPHVLSSLVAAVVKHFANQNKSILVLGRTHMQKWSNANLSYIKQKADTFLAQSLSQDDPYLLYCALNSGLNTIIVSRDLMRSHLFKLNDPKLKLLFSRWLTLNLHPLDYVNQGRAYFKQPPLFTRTAQKVQNSWHIPYDEPVSNSNASAVENKWLCVNI